MNSEFSFVENNIPKFIENSPSLQYFFINSLFSKFFIAILKIFSLG